MKNARQLMATLAAALLVTTLFGTSALADWRHQDETKRGGYRDNQRVNVEGRVRTFSRERDGYRVQLDRDNYSYWIPERSLRNYGRDLRAGLSVRIGGVFRGGMVNVDVIDFPGGYDNYDPYNGSGRGYSSGTISGVVESVDFRRGALLLRDDRSGRLVDVDLVRADRRSRSLGLDDLRRGDYVQLSGDWARGMFQAYRVESVRNGRY